MKVGDRVRFLNSVGGGVVARFGDKGIVHVMTDDGFEIPVMARELVVVEETNSLNFKVEKPATQTESQPEPKRVVQYEFDEADETPEGEQISLYMAFVPKNIKALQTTDSELYLVNDSNYYIDFQLLLGKDEVKVKLQDTIEPQTKIFLDNVPKDEVNDYEFLCLQGLAYKRERAFQPKPAIDATLRINPVDFYKLHRFVDNDFFDSKAMMISILERDFTPMEELIDPKQLQEAMQEKRPQPTKKEFAQPKKPEVLEIDLHIHELVENTANLSNHDMLKIQLDKFRKVMDENQKKRGQKIVFIHGKGDGVLRKELTDCLRKEYKRATFQDASFQRYGFGATMVIIR